MNSIFIIFLLVLPCITTASPQDSTSRGKALLIGGTAAYTASLLVLNQVWYAEHEKSSFHFFNDNAEWKQVDKLGHFYNSFHISNLSYHAAKWAYVPNDKALLAGSLAALAVMTPIEILDGFSDAYGASIGDIVANISGSALFYSQHKLWHEIRIHPKLSYNPSTYAARRPEVLGGNTLERIIKDYNAHTFWFSVDVSKFTNFPKWLNIAVGYAGREMIYARDAANKAAGLNPHRRYFIAVDFDVNEYKARSKFLNTVLQVVNLIHIPAPALSYYNDKFKFHLIHY